ncbi:protein S100-G-like [Pelodytes ibericus]
MALNLETCMVSIMAIFNKHSSKDGKPGSLNKDELCELVFQEFPTLCGNAKKDDIMNGIFGKMDMDGNNEVDYREFMIFLTFLSIAMQEQLFK